MASRVAATAGLRGPSSRATAQYEEAAGELDAAKKKVSDLDAVYRDLGVRRGALERELSALSKDAEKMTAERETARRRHAENTEALSDKLDSLLKVK